MWPRPTCQKQQVQQVQLDVHVHSELRLCAEHRIHARVKLVLPDTWKLSRGLYKLGGTENGWMDTGIAGNMVAVDVELSVVWLSPPFQLDNAIPWLSGRVFRDQSCLLPVLYHVCRHSLISSSLVALSPLTIYLFIYSSIFTHLGSECPAEEQRCDGFTFRDFFTLGAFPLCPACPCRRRPSSGHKAVEFASCHPPTVILLGSDQRQVFSFISAISSIPLILLEKEIVA